MEEIKDKNSLRDFFRNKRNSLDPDLKRSLDNSICASICGLIEYRNSNRILVYSPIRNEINLNGLWDNIVADGKSTLFPRCFGKEMLFADISVKQLVRGNFGIMEPPIEAEYVTDFTSSDVCILPCLAVDRSGYRLGYGGGFYDRFLVDFPGVKIAAVYSDFVVDSVFLESFDIPADIIVTEEGIFKP